MGYGVTGIAIPLPGAATPYPVTEDVNELGGWRAVADTASRNAILPTFRKIGMVVVTQDTGIAWQLVGGIADANWAAFNPLPNPVAADIGDTLAVISDGLGGSLWARAANAFIGFTTIALRNAYVGLKTPGMLVYVSTTQCLYMLAADGATWQFYAPSPALASQATWFVDPSGNDNNDGLTGGTALATLVELSRRLCPNGQRCMLTNNVTINVNTITLTVQTYGQMDFSFGSNVNPVVAVFTVTFVFGITSTAPITLSAVTTASAVAATRGELTTLAGTFVSQERIRLVSGTSSGAVCYSTGLHTGVLNTYISQWYFPRLQGLVAANATVGDTCVVDTLLCTVSRCNIQCFEEARVIIQDAKITGLNIGGAVNGTLFTGGGGPVWLMGCQQTSATGHWENTCNGANAVCCRTIATSKTSLIGNNWFIVGHVVQGTLGLNGSTFSYGICLDGGKLIVGVDADFNHPGLASTTKLCVNTNQITGGGGLEAENGTGGATAITVCDGSEMRVDDTTTYFWGASANYGVGFAVMGNAYVAQNNVSTGVILAIYKIPSTVNWLVGAAANGGGKQFSYSDNPIVFPNSNCGLISISPNGGVQNQSDDGFYLTNQSGNQGPTVFAGMTGSGMYMVYGYVATTVLDVTAVGTPTLNVIYTDDSGAVQTKAVAIDPSLTSLGGVGGNVVIESNAASISWSISGITTPATSKYSVRSRITRVSNGP